MDWSLCFEIIVALNATLAVITIFRRPRDIAAIWAWLLVLIIFPVGGFIVYAFFGRKLPKSKLFKLQGRAKKEVQKTVKRQRKELNEGKMQNVDNADVILESNNLVKMFMNSAMSVLSHGNKLKLYTTGEDLFGDMINDIKEAKDSINIEFYTFYADKLGHQILDELIKKSKSGVDVKVIYDSWGSNVVSGRFFKPLIEAGGHVESFLHTHSNFFDFRINFRDHHKIVVIDGKYGYVGGFNIGDQYMGWSKKFGPWRDTTIKVEGSGVFGLQDRFILDWNASNRDNQIDIEDMDVIKKYLPTPKVAGNSSMQTVSSGPDSELEQIKKGYNNLIATAKEKVYINTPYLIPDESVLDTLKSAALSGVDVRIVMPSFPDHMFVYRASQYYAKILASYGVKIYYYNQGFMHAKTIMIDDKVSSVGSANFDYRSFKLNFEINSFIYDRDFAKQMNDLFMEDLKVSTLQTKREFAKQSLWLSFKQQFSRLFSPIL
ncbi:cardiolipin synthase [Lactobacillus sp. S2-2]|nr:cardiolipin synthase [Lactobacillus sp. S2-2]MCF6515408.1 cardiolipin synthase [Lactobacillus sp. S2-2]